MEDDEQDSMDGMRRQSDHMHSRSRSPSEEYGRHMSSSFKPRSRFEDPEYGSGNSNPYEDDGDLDGHGPGRKMMHRNHDIAPGQDNENEYGRSRFGNGNDRGPEGEQEGFGSPCSSVMISGHHLTEAGRS